MAVHSYGADIYTEPVGDPDTLANLGPLRPMAGVWEGAMGADSHPVVEGIGLDVFTEHYEAHPIDFQTNGPQLFYGLRYHTHILSPGEAGTFHDQVGYWLWEPAAEAVTLTLGIPRGQVLLATGPATADATDFELTALLGSETNGIASNPFLLQAFRTISYRIHVTLNDDGTWSYEEEGLIETGGSGLGASRRGCSRFPIAPSPTRTPTATRCAWWGRRSRIRCHCWWRLQRRRRLSPKRALRLATWLATAVSASGACATTSADRSAPSTPCLRPTGPASLRISGRPRRTGHRST